MGLCLGVELGALPPPPHGHLLSRLKWEDDRACVEVYKWSIDRVQLALETLRKLATCASLLAVCLLVCRVMGSGKMGRECVVSFPASVRFSFKDT